ncbi:glycosyltransferase [Orrella sp. JC864]|uniref:glycosyltransferase n=1 Tax=Orrella sp. JC864 TaxID=3120298 RepID=UPI003008451F
MSSSNNSDAFDASWYARQYPDVKLSGMDPALHYERIGKLLGRPPNPASARQAPVSENPAGPATPPPASAATPPASARPPSQAAPRPASHKAIRGGLNLGKPDSPMVRGWLAKIGDDSPRLALLKIGSSVFKIECKNYRKDLVQAKINKGHHAFDFMLPLEFIDGKEHSLTLEDSETGKVVATGKAAWISTRTYNDFKGYLAESFVNPTALAPFREEDKRCFAAMECVARSLQQAASRLPEPPLFTVVMPVYNRIACVDTAVASVRSQSYPHFELLLVDDCSTDGSFERLEELAKEDSRLRVFRTPCNSGASAARNLALRNAQGKYIAYLDSDNTWQPGYLGAMAGAFARFADASALYSGQLLYRGNAEHPFAVRFGSLNRSLLLNRNYIDLNAFCHTRDVLEITGAFDESLQRYVDYDLILRIIDNCTVRSVPVLLSNYFYDKAENTITNDARHLDQIHEIRRRSIGRIAARIDGKPPQEPAPLTRRVSIIIPSYQAPEDIRECIQAVKALPSNESIDLIVVDNASDRNVVDYLSELAERGAIKLIANKRNFGFTYAVNQGIAISDPQSDVILLNNDAIVSRTAVAAMQHAAYQLEQCGLVVPQQVLPGKTKTIQDHVPYANPEHDCDVNISSHHANIVNPPLFHDGKFLELSFAPFFCVYIKREMLDDGLWLDAEFGRHYRSDRIFCDYVRHIRNRKIFHVADAIVYHKLQKSTDLLRSDAEKAGDFNAIFKKNQWTPELAKELGFRTAAWDI